LPEDANEPESDFKELDRKELSENVKDVLELPEELYQESEEDSDESKAVIVVVFVWAAPTKKANAKAVFCIMAE